MLRPRTLKILAALLTGYVLLVIPAYWGPSCLEEFSSRFAMMPLFSIYIFHSVGIPGLLEHGGACGWGWCAPTRVRLGRAGAALAGNRLAECVGSGTPDRAFETGHAMKRRACSARVGPRTDARR